MARCGHQGPGGTQCVLPEDVHADHTDGKAIWDNPEVQAAFAAKAAVGPVKTGLPKAREIAAGIARNADKIEHADPIGTAPDYTVARDFMAFHRENPDIYLALLKVAQRAAERGYSKWAIAGAFEVVRWEWSEINPAANGGFKLPNNWKPWYARLIMVEHPELDGLFDLRSCPADVLRGYLAEASSAGRPV